MNQTIENIQSKTKLAAGTAIFAVRAVLPLALRIAALWGMAAFLLFLYVHGPRNFIEFLLSCLVSAADVFWLPILKLHEDPSAAALFAVLIYGGTGLVLFHPKSPIFWITAFMLLLPVSDAIYGLRYCFRAFRRHWNNPDTFFRSAKRFLKNEPFLGFAIFHEPPEKRALFLETDTSVLLKMEKLGAWFREAFPKEKIVPYVERVDMDGNRTVFTCFRPSGFPLVKFAEEKDSNPFLHALGYGTETHSVSAKNVRKLRITVEDISKPIPALPFSRILPLVRKSEYVFGMDVDRNEIVRMPLKEGANSALFLAGVPASGKSSLISALIMELIEANVGVKGDGNGHAPYQFVVTTSKPDLLWLKGLPQVVRYADDPRGIIDAVNFLIRQVDLRKRLFQAKNVRDIAEYHALDGADDMPIICAFVDEISDSMKMIESEFGSKILDNYQRAITQLTIKARSYGILMNVAAQSALVSLFSQNGNGSEFRNCYQPISFCLRSKSSETSLFGSVEGAYRLPVGQAIWFDPSIADFRRIKTPLVEKSDIDAFLAKHGTKAPEANEKSAEEKYLEYARLKGSFSIKEGMAHGVSERRLRAMSEMLQASSEIMKRPDNSLIFVPEVQSENGLQNTASESESDDCKTSPGDDCKNQRIDSEEP